MKALSFIQSRATEGSDPDDGAPVRSRRKIYVCALLTGRIEDDMRNDLCSTALKVVAEDC